MKVCFFAWRGSSALLPVATGYVRLAPNDWLNAATLHGVVKRDRAKHVAMIRHGTGRHAQFFGAFGQGFDLNSAVEEAVIGVQMKVSELLFLHKTY